MKILTEKDLEYFERLEAEGKAVIFRFEDTEELLQYDLEKLLAMPSEELDEETVRIWMRSGRNICNESEYTSTWICHVLVFLDHQT